MAKKKADLPLGRSLGIQVKGQPLSDFTGKAIRPCIIAPVQIEATAELEEFPDTQFDVRLGFDDERKTYRVEHLGITSPSGISTADLHSYSIPTLVSMVASNGVFIELDDITKGGAGKYAHIEEVFEMMDFEGTRKVLAVQGPTPQALWHVALIYAYARTIGMNPNSAVVTILGLPQRTATRWIARAKADGLVD